MKTCILGISDPKVSNRVPNGDARDLSDYDLKDCDLTVALSLGNAHTSRKILRCDSKS